MAIFPYSLYSACQQPSTPSSMTFCWPNFVSHISLEAHYWTGSGPNWLVGWSAFAAACLSTCQLCASEYHRGPSYASCCLFSKRPTWLISLRFTVFISSACRWSHTSKDPVTLTLTHSSPLSDCLDEWSNWIRSKWLQIILRKVRRSKYSGALHPACVICCPLPIRIGVDYVSSLSAVHDMGIMIDNTTHVSRIVFCCFASLHQIRSIRRFVSTSVFIFTSL